MPLGRRQKVVLWWGLFDDNLYAEHHREERMSPISELEELGAVYRRKEGRGGTCAIWSTRASAHI
jgi:hypothetical protein